MYRKGLAILGVERKHICQAAMYQCAGTTCPGRCSGTDFLSILHEKVFIFGSVTEGEQGTHWAQNLARQKRAELVLPLSTFACLKKDQRSNKRKVLFLRRTSII